MRFAFIFAVVLGAVPMGVGAQDAQTLADIRQELVTLNVEMRKLRRELSTTGMAGGTSQLAADSVLDRVSAMESELSRVTAKTEELEFRINRIVEDGTRRIADLEFRLVELEGGDISTLGETTTLGGADQATAPAPLPQGNNTQLAVGEKDDFERAQAALASGDFRGAAAQFETFNQTYPGSPLAVEADLRRGDALKKMGDTREAARAYLTGFGAAPTGPVAAETLFKLGAALGALGQSSEACVTLGEVPLRFPDSPFGGEAAAEQQKLGC